MREIKFRAWIGKDIKQMRDVLTIEMFEQDDIMTRLPRVQVWNHASTRAAKIKGKVAEYYKKDVILMQYTGLKDKNGVEIYEGDIVKITDAVTSRYEVRWNILRGYWSLRRTGYDNIEINYMLGDCIDNLECEVIGNIYENAELLTTSKE